MTASDVETMGFSRAWLPVLAKQGLLQRVGRGVYQAPDSLEDTMWLVQHRFSRGVFSHGTALNLLGLSDRTPPRFDMTFPARYNTSMARKAGVRCWFTAQVRHQMGVVEVESPEGRRILAYSAERTLCEMLQRRAHSDIQVVTAAFQQYAACRKKEIPSLLAFAKLFRVEKLVQTYLEVQL